MFVGWGLVNLQEVATGEQMVVVHGFLKQAQGGLFGREDSAFRLSGFGYVEIKIFHHRGHGGH
jgi:hypothetical protein